MAKRKAEFGDVFATDVILGVILGWVIDAIMQWATVGLPAFPNENPIIPRVTIFEPIHLDDVIAMVIPLIGALYLRGRWRRICAIAFWTVVVFELYEYVQLGAGVEK